MLRKQAHSTRETPNTLQALLVQGSECGLANTISSQALTAVSPWTGIRSLVIELNCRSGPEADIVLYSLLSWVKRAGKTLAPPQTQIPVLIYFPKQLTPTPTPIHHKWGPFSI